MLAIVRTAPSLAAASPEILFLEPARASRAPLPAVIEVARDQLAELGVTLRVAQRPRDARLSATTAYAQARASASSAIAVVWLDRQERATTIYFYEAKVPRLLTRRVSVSQSEAAAAEEVALILRSAISAVLEGGDVAMTEIEVPKPEPRPVNEPPPEKVMLLPSSQSSSQLGIGLGYTGTRLSSGGTWQNGARLFVEFTPDETRWVLGLSYGIFPVLTLQNELATTQVSRHPSELFAAFMLGSSDFRVLPEVRLMGDYVRRTTESADPPLERTAASGRFLWSVSGHARARFTVTTRLRVFSSVGADILLNPYDQVAIVSNEEAVVFSPLRVRPRVEAGFSVDIF